MPNTNQKIQYIGNPSNGMVRSFSSMGTYPIYYITKSFDCLSAQAVEDNIRACNDPNDPLFVIEHAVNWENEDLTCDITGNTIECAYPSD